MYKGLSLAILAALISYCYLQLSPLDLYHGFLHPLNATSSTVEKSSNNAYNVSEMAMASVSRSVVKKVLSVETPEVRALFCDFLQVTG